jgi:hypothetical protein
MRQPAQDGDQKLDRFRLGSMFDGLLAQRNAVEPCNQAQAVGILPPGHQHGVLGQRWISAIAHGCLPVEITTRIAEQGQLEEFRFSAFSTICPKVAQKLR